MINKTKLNNLFKIFIPDETKVDFSNFDNEIQKLKESLKEKIQVQILELERVRKQMSFEPLLAAFKELKTSLTDKDNRLIKELDERITGFNIQINSALTSQNKKVTKSLNKKTAGLVNDISILFQQQIEISNFVKQIQNTKKELTNLVELSISDINTQSKTNNEKVQKQFAVFEQAMKKLRIEALSWGGGSMNRNIAVGGNSSVLSRYNDINIKPGSNITLSYSNNNTTKYLDLTIAGTGGGSGITRSIATTTVSSTVGAVAATDYVVLANGGVQITLPTAVSNTNLYTVKNIGTSSVLVSTSAAQTIDGATTLIMPVQYTSVDITSDNSNWSLT